MDLKPAPGEARAVVLAAAALLMVPVGPAVAWAVHEAMPCEGLACAAAWLVYAGAAVLVVGVAWGFLLRQPREAWAPALTGLLAPLAYLAWQGDLDDALGMLGFILVGAALVAAVAGLTLAARGSRRPPAPVQDL